MEDGTTHPMSWDALVTPVDHPCRPYGYLECFAAVGTGALYWETVGLLLPEEGVRLFCHHTTCQEKIRTVGVEVVWVCLMVNIKSNKEVE